MAENRPERLRLSKEAQDILFVIDQMGADDATKRAVAEQLQIEVGDARRDREKNGRK